MTIGVLLEELHKRNVRPLLKNGKLTLAGPKDSLTPDLVEWARDRKTELIALLSRPQPRPDLETERIARLDDERFTRDRAIGRGYDVDLSTPSRAEYQERQTCARLIDAAEAERRAGLVPCPPCAAAKSLIRTCREHGIGLHVERDGTLVVTSYGHAWRSLVNAIEIHADDVAVLVASGWSDA